MRNRSLIGTISLVLVGFIFGTLLVTSFGWDRPTEQEIQLGAKNAPVQEINIDAQKMNNAFAEVAEKVTPSIVEITVVSSVKISEKTPFHNFFRFKDDAPRERQGGGSGVIISKDGYILTNNHVVENATSVKVKLKDKRSFSAVIVGTDPLTDLAVIKIEGDELPIIYLGDSEKIRIGEWVMAIGNPLSFSSTVTAGIISAIGRDLDIIQGKSKEDISYAIENFIQTDAVINPGNSGGALVDLSGALIGINTAIATNGMSSNYIGYGFAIPVNLAKAVAEDLIEFGSVRRGYIGVSIEEINASTAKAIGLDKPRGVMIQRVVENGSASAEDIREGDVLLKIDGREVNQPNQLQSYVGSKRAGDVVKLLLFRNGKEITRNVKLKARDEETENIVSLDDETSQKPKSLDQIQQQDFEIVGLSLKEMTLNEKQKYEIKEGLLITDIKQFGSAYNQRLAPGLVILSVNQNNIDSVNDFKKIINDNKGKAILLKVKRTDGVTRFVGLDIPQD